jgi:hypothetical protein
VAEITSGEGEKVADIVSRIHELQLQAQHLAEAVAQVGALPHLVAKIREVESALQTARAERTVRQARCVDAWYSRHDRTKPASSTSFVEPEPSLRCSRESCHIKPRRDSQTFGSEGWPESCGARRGVHGRTLEGGSPLAY